MLRNLKVRTKIVVILIPLIAVIVGMGAIEVNARLNDADQAGREGDLLELAGTTTSLADAVAAQAWAAVGTLSGLGEGTFADASLAVFDARTQFEQTAARFESSTDILLVQAIENTRTSLAELDTMEEGITEGTYDVASLGQSVAIVLDAANELIDTIGPRVQVGGANLDLASAELKVHSANLALGIDAVRLSEVPFESRDTSVIESGRTLVDDLTIQILTLADADVATQIRDIQATDAYRVTEVELASVIAGEEVNAVDFAERFAARSEIFSDAAADEIQTQLTVVSDARNQERTAARNFALVAVAALVLAIVAASFVTRSITRPLRKLTDSTYVIATERLPRLVDRLRSPEAEGAIAAELQPIDIRSHDEIGQLAAAFNTMQKVTGEVAEQQANMLRRGISELFVNLARRNQSLLDRQIEFIDQLEANEEDPDQLENLFRLDHLATRMRRNAESLLVLAGADPGRRRGRPVALSDVIRVAIGEVEHYARIGVATIDNIQIRGNVAVDLAHLLAELMDNATSYSPPDTRVEVTGRRVGEHSYVMSVSDAGIGMSEKQMAELNLLLSRPPAVGLDLSRSLGLTVVARLAHRHGIAVRLMATDGGDGLTAELHLPAETFEIVTPAGVENPEISTFPTSQPNPVWAATSPDLDTNEPMIEPVDQQTAPAEQPAVSTLAWGETWPGADDVESVKPAEEGSDAGETSVTEATPVSVTETDDSAVPAAPVSGTSGIAPAPLPRLARPTNPVVTPDPDEVGAETVLRHPGHGPTWLATLPPPPPPETYTLVPSASSDASIVGEPTARATQPIDDEPGDDGSFTEAISSDEASLDETSVSAEEPTPSLEDGAAAAEEPVPAAEDTTLAPVETTSSDPDAVEISAALPTRQPLATRQPGATAPSSAPGSSVTATQRSPEEVRRMLSRYRSGVRRGQEATDMSPAEQPTGSEA